MLGDRYFNKAFPTPEIPNKCVELFLISPLAPVPTVTSVSFAVRLIIDVLMEVTVVINLVRAVEVMAVFTSSNSSFIPTDEVKEVVPSSMRNSNSNEEWIINKLSNREVGMAIYMITKVYVQREECTTLPLL